MIEEVVSVELPVHERLVVRKNRLMNKDENHSTPRISIVTGTHGDELDGQLICYEIIRRIEREKDKLKGIVDIYPDINPRGRVCQDTFCGFSKLNDLSVKKSPKTSCLQMS